MKFQLNLSKEPLKLNRNFLREIYTMQGLSKVNRWFDIIPSGSIQSVIDNKMSLNLFIKNLTTSAQIFLEVNSPEFGEIRYCANQDQRFAWVVCSFSKENYQNISEKFNTVYEISLESFILNHPIKY